MTFPYRPSVHDDLRDLFGYRRTEFTSRNLGASSITKGEGSLDLYETDDGPVTHRYGDLPGGAFGVGITHRGAFWNVSDLIGAGEDRDDAQDDRMDGHASRLGSAEGRLDGHDSTLASHNSRITTAQARADKGVSDAAAAQSSADAAQSSANAAQSSANTAQDRADSAYSRAGTGISDAATAQSRADAAYALASGAATSGQLNTLANTVAGIGNKQTTIEQWLTDNLGYPMPMQ